MIIASGGNPNLPYPSHGRNNSSEIYNSRRQEEILKEQKRQAANEAIQDQYAMNMFNTQNYRMPEDEVNQMGSLSQSYRNVGIAGVKGSAAQAN